MIAAPNNLLFYVYSFMRLVQKSRKTNSYYHSGFGRRYGRWQKIVFKCAQLRKSVIRIIPYFIISHFFSCLYQHYWMQRWCKHLSFRMFYNIFFDVYQWDGWNRWFICGWLLACVGMHNQDTRPNMIHVPKSRRWYTWNIGMFFQLPCHTYVNGSTFVEGWIVLKLLQIIVLV